MDTRTVGAISANSFSSTGLTTIVTSLFDMMSSSCAFMLAAAARCAVLSASSASRS